MDSLIGEAATEWGSPSPRAVEALALSSVLTQDSGWYHCCFLVKSREPLFEESPVSHVLIDFHFRIRYYG